MISACESIAGLIGILCKIQELFNSAIPVLIALGVVYFVWGVVRYVIADGEEAKKKGRDSMIFGVIGLAVIISLWGIVIVVLSTFNLNDDGNNNAPTKDELQNLLPK